MLVFGPYRSIPRDVDFKVFNLTSQTQVIERLPGLFPALYDQSFINNGELEKQFDQWYYNYIMNDPTAMTSVMIILQTLYNGDNVYVCISEYSSDPIIALINESFMKFIQQRYDIKYSIINEPEDFDYVPHDGCDIMSVYGIQNFDEDRMKFERLKTEQGILGNYYV